MAQSRAHLPSPRSGPVTNPPARLYSRDNPEEGAVLAEPIRAERGELAPPSRPGYSIVLYDAAFRRYEVTGKITDVVPTRT